MENKKISNVVDLDRVRVTDSFWKKEIGMVRDTVIPYQWEALNDRVADAQPSYCMHNFRVAGAINQRLEQEADYIQPVHTTNGFCVWPENPGAPEEKFYGFVFQDSDFAKWIEAVAYILRQYPNPELEAAADEAIEVVCRAQQPDGYLDTFYIINDISKRFTNLRDHHELYCLGHLIEGAVAYYKATGKNKLLNAACRYADCVAEHIGPEDGKLHGYPGHEIAEMALAKLYEVTGEKKYRNLGLYFVNERGKKPYYYDMEHSVDADKEEELRYQYHQAHLPVREQTEAVGHAVRAVYLYSGMADFARLTLDEALEAACERIWDDITQTKMYITGGIGGTHIGEAFSFAYDLPNDTAYAETCASIGMIFFAQRMLRMKPDSKYADTMERELYNIILGGMGLDGTSFFYVNPLEVVPKSCHEDSRKEHVKPVRQKWFGCACCPPNLARLISSIGAYVFTETDDTVFIHLYIGAHMEKRMRTGTAKIDIESGFPWNGNVSVRVECETEEVFTIALRIPNWCRQYKITGTDNTDTAKESSGLHNTEDGGKLWDKEVYAIRKVEKDGYLYVTKAWKSDTIQIEFPMEIRVIEADPRVRETIGKMAVQRGPVVYCLEEADNGKDLHLLKMDEKAWFEEGEKQIASQTVIVVKAQGWRQQKAQGAGLYFVHTGTKYERTTLTWIPYYAWANRGEGEMQVWTRI